MIYIWTLGYLLPLVVSLGVYEPIPPSRRQNSTSYYGSSAPYNSNTNYINGNSNYINGNSNNFNGMYGGRNNKSNSYPTSRQQQSGGGGGGWSKTSGRERQTGSANINLLDILDRIESSNQESGAAGHGYTGSPPTPSVNGGYGNNGYNSNDNNRRNNFNRKNSYPYLFQNRLPNVVANNRKKYTRDYGTFIGRLEPHAHGISGYVYAVDERNLFIKNFQYDGTGPDAYFWVGDDVQPSPRGMIVPYPPEPTTGVTTGTTASRRGGGSRSTTPSVSYRNRGRKQRGRVTTDDSEVRARAPPGLKKMINENVLLTLPGNYKVTDIRWLAVWCTRFTVNYGEVYIPKKLNIPKSVSLGPFESTSDGQQLISDTVTILDSESLYIPNLQMAIEDNGYHFWTGNSSDRRPNDMGQKVADEKARYDDLHLYNGQDIIVTLPSPLTVFDVNYLAVYNDQSKNTLGYISFDVTGEMVPPALGQTKKPGWWFEIPTLPPPSISIPAGPAVTDNNGRNEVPVFNHTLQLPNCKELLGRKIRLQWARESDNTEVYFRLQVHMAEATQFAAIGIAVQNSEASDIEADFVKIFFNETSQQFQTQDAFLAKKIYCDFTNGLCADNQHESKDQVTFMGGFKNHGLSTIDFKRSILPLDRHDAPIPFDAPTQVVVAIGDMKVNFGTYKTSLNLETENATIDFSSNGNTCPDRTHNRIDVVPEVEEVWEKPTISDVEYLVAVLGPTGGRKGYGAITGEPPGEKSVCWWINDKLLPEIYVERGKTYIFRVQGGDGRQHRLLYHPLYITSDREGGYGNKNQYERERETIYAGVKNEYGIVGTGPLFNTIGGRRPGVGRNDAVSTQETPSRDSSRNPGLLADSLNSNDQSGRYGLAGGGGGGGGGAIGSQGGDFQPTGIGPLCELVSKDGADKADESTTFNDYFDTLQLACEQQRRNTYGWVNWTVAQETPDIVYYQSFYAYGLGWKIHVLDEGAEPSRSTTAWNLSFAFLICLLGAGHVWHAV